MLPIRACRPWHYRRQAAAAEAIHKLLVFHMHMREMYAQAVSAQVPTPLLTPSPLLSSRILKSWPSCVRMIGLHLIEVANTV